ncbi:hypothetical protein D3C84_1045790 [compost metagenome]
MCCIPDLLGRPAFALERNEPFGNHVLEAFVAVCLVGARHFIDEEDALVLYHVVERLAQRGAVASAYHRRPKQGTKKMEQHGLTHPAHF